MPHTQKRAYSSPARQHQAEATRKRIADAAAELLTQSGYAGMTIAGLARKAGVAQQTVYAIFGSKRGILGELFRRVVNTVVTTDVMERVRVTTDPLEVLRVVAHINRRLHEEKNVAFAAVRGSAMVSPDLADLEKEIEQMRYEKQAPLIAKLRDGNRLRSDVSDSALRDMLWSLTSPELYRLLVQERAWQPEDYEAWLISLLTHSLLTPPPQSGQ